MKNTISRLLFIAARLLAIVLVFLAISVAQAQEHKPAQSAQHAQEHQKPQDHQSGVNEQFGQPLAAQSSEAAHPEAHENDQEKMVEELRQSPAVRWMASHLHISPAAGYWVGYILDFAILGLLIYLALKKNLPAAFRSRTATIQRGIEEAQKASEEANRRLADIDARLAKLDDEIAAMRTAAEEETAAEEQRIQAAAEEDKRRIVEAAESEIAAAAKQARHELKAFTADLAVSLAERRIDVDSATDGALIRSFTEQLARPAGKDGQQ